MGCDIHGAIEIKDGDRWRLLMQLGSIWRSYAMFARLARCGRNPETEPVVENRGWPRPNSGYSMSDIGGEHSATWLTPAEFTEAVRRCDAEDVGGVHDDYRLIANFMKSLEGAGFEARINICFDS